MYAHIYTSVHQKQTEYASGDCFYNVKKKAQAPVRGVPWHFLEHKRLP